MIFKILFFQGVLGRRPYFIGLLALAIAAVLLSFTIGVPRSLGAFLRAQPDPVDGIATYVVIAGLGTYIGLALLVARFRDAGILGPIRAGALIALATAFAAGMAHNATVLSVGHVPAATYTGALWLGLLVFGLFRSSARRSRSAANVGNGHTNTPNASMAAQNG